MAQQDDSPEIVDTDDWEVFHQSFLVCLQCESRQDLTLFYNKWREQDVAVDVLMRMTMTPGFKGQDLNPELLERIRALRAEMGLENLDRRVFNGDRC